MATTPSYQPTRLIYGRAAWAGPDENLGEIYDAVLLARIAAAAAAGTSREFVKVVYGERYEAWIEEWDVGTYGIGEPDDPVNVGEWYSESGVRAPQDVAWEVAWRRVKELVDADPALTSGIDSGGASPGGNINTIAGTLEALTALAAHIGPDDDFTLERDDAAIEAARGGGSTEPSSLPHPSYRADRPLSRSGRERIGRNGGGSGGGRGPRGPGASPPDSRGRDSSGWLDFLRRLLHQLNPARRPRSAPRVIKRKYVKWHVKRARHATWPQPTSPPTYATPS